MSEFGQGEFLEEQPGTSRPSEQGSLRAMMLMLGEKLQEVCQHLKGITENPKSTGNADHGASEVASVQPPPRSDGFTNNLSDNTQLPSENVPVQNLTCENFIHVPGTNMQSPLRTETSTPDRCGESRGAVTGCSAPSTSDDFGSQQTRECPTGKNDVELMKMTQMSSPIFQKGKRRRVH